MRKSFAGFAAGLALIIGLYGCAKEQPKGTSTAAPQNTEKEEVVFVNSDSLLSKYEYFKTVRSQFEDKSKRAQADLNSRNMAFQREVVSFQENAASLSADQRAATEQRLARKQQELAMYNQNAGNDLANQEAQENEKLYNRVSEYLKKYAKEKGYKMVLTYSKANSAVLYGDESLDVTEEVVKGLNDEYKKEKK